MNVVYIGKGMLRATIQSEELREHLAGIAGVRIEGTRVVFPELLLDNINAIVDPHSTTTRSAKMN